MKKSFCLTLLAIFVLCANLNAQNKGYEKSIELGYAVGIGKIQNDIFNISMINGYRLNNTFFIGVGVGIGYSDVIYHYKYELGNITEFRSEVWLVPIFANIKVNLTNESKVSPFLSFDIGYTIDANQYLRDAPGFMFKPNFGVDFKITQSVSIYTKIGINLQHFNYTYTRIGINYPIDWEMTDKSEMLKAIDIKIGFKF